MTAGLKQEVSLAELAHYLGIKKQTLYARVMRGGAPGAHQISAAIRSKWVIPLSTVRDRWPDIYEQILDDHANAILSE